MPRQAKALAPGPGTKLDLARLVPALLTFIANRMTNSGSATYRRRFGIGIMEFRIMVMLDLESGASGTRIAEVIGLDKGAVSRTLRALEHRGLVEISTGHGNVNASHMTPRGRALYDKARLICIERENRLLKSFTAAEQETLRVLLRKMLANTSHVAELAQVKRATGAAGKRSVTPRRR